MTRTQKVLLLGFLFLCLCLVAGAAVGMFLFVRKVTETPVSQNDPAVPAREAEKARREAAQAAKVRLSPESGIPPDWEFAQALEQWDQELDYVTRRIVSGGRDVPRDALADILRLATAENSPARVAAELDPRTHSAEQILETVYDRLASSDSLAVFERAMRYGLCYMPYEIEKPYWRQSQPYRNARDTLTRHLIARGIVFARRSDSIRALETYFSLLDFADQVAAEPFIDNQTNCIWIQTGADKILWALFDTCSIDQIDVGAIQKRLDARKDTTQLARVINEDARLVRTRQMQNPLFAEPGGLFMRFMFSLADPTDYDRVERNAQDIVALLGRPYYEVADQLQAIIDEAGTEWYEADFAETCADAFRDHTRSAFFADVFPVALALKRFRAATGGYPEALHGLAPVYVPSVPQDPTVGKPVLYMRCGAGFLIVAPPDYEYYGTDEFDTYYSYDEYSDEGVRADWETADQPYFYEIRKILWSAEN